MDPIEQYEDYTIEQYEDYTAALKRFNQICQGLRDLKDHIELYEKTNLIIPVN